MTVVRSVGGAGAPGRQRALELAPSQILVVMLDAEGGLRSWQVMPDPRLLRAETPAANGQISGQEFYRSAVDFTVECPDDAAIKELRFYHPAPREKELRLELVGNALLN